MAELVIRDYDPDGDFALVIDSWMESYMRARPWIWRHVGKQRAWAGHRGVVSRLINETTIRVACLEDTPDAILGWAAHEPHVLHYCFVKHAHRHLGIARMLIQEADEAADGLQYISHSTEAWKNRKMRPDLRYSPGHAFYPEPQ